MNELAANGVTVELHTFSILAMDLLNRILLFGMRAGRIDVIFDEYRNLSMKNIERNRMSRGQLLFKKIVATTAIKYWWSFLSCNENKNP